MGKLHLLKLVLLIFIVANIIVFWMLPSKWKQNKIIKLILALFHILGCIGLLAIFLFYKHIPEGILKQFLLTIGSINFVYIMYLSFLLIIFYMSYIIPKKFKLTFNSYYQAFSNRIIPFTISVIVAFTIACIGVFRMSLPVQITKYDIKFEKNISSPINAVLISDVHLGCGSSNKIIESLAKKIKSLKPDLLLISGDVFDETTSDENIKCFIENFKTINTKYGNYYCYGNHDVARKEDAAKSLEKANITILENKSTTLENNLTIIGHCDIYGNEKEIPDIIKDDNISSNSPILLLHHDPKYLERFSKQQVNLVLCGHTHGERYPLEYYPVVLLAQNYPVYGRAEFDRMTAITTSGTTCWGIHYKFPAINEIVQLNLH